jgi:hypothetical protein
MLFLNIFVFYISKSVIYYIYFMSPPKIYDYQGKHLPRALDYLSAPEYISATQHKRILKVMAKDRAKKTPPNKYQKLFHGNFDKLKEKARRTAFLAKAHTKKLFFKPKAYKKNEIEFDFEGPGPQDRKRAFEQLKASKPAVLEPGFRYKSYKDEQPEVYMDIRQIPHKKLPANRIPLKGLRPVVAPLDRDKIRADFSQRLTNRHERTLKAAKMETEKLRHQRLTKQAKAIMEIEEAEEKKKHPTQDHDYVNSVQYVHDLWSQFGLPKPRRR